MSASVRCDRKAASATDNPAPTPAPPTAPAQPPMNASTATAAMGATLPGAATSINPPAIPPTMPARPPPIDAAAHRVAAIRAARRNRRPTSAPAVAIAAGSPRIGTGPPRGVSQRVSRSSARANACRGRVPRRCSASDVPSECSTSAASRCASSSSAFVGSSSHRLQQAARTLESGRRTQGVR